MTERKQVAVKKINNQEVKVIKLDKQIDKRPARGHETISECFANIFICARKNSGKTSVVNHILEQCAGPKTKIIAYVSTLDKDPSWSAIRKKFKDRFIGYTSIIDEDSGEDILGDFVRERILEAKEEREKKDQRDEEHDAMKGFGPIDHNIIDFGGGSKEIIEKKGKYKELEYIIIFDDMSSDLKNRNIAPLLKRNRHFKCKTIISSQNFSDLTPESRRQIDIFIVFGGFSKIYLEKLYAEALISIPLDVFIDIYHEATKEQYSFLLIDTRNNQFRIKFDKEIII